MTATATVATKAIMNEPPQVAPEVKITKDGPYLVSGPLPLATAIIGTNEQGESIQWIAGTTFPTRARCALCRCGRSGKKPFCDGTHAKVGFDGTETASQLTYREQAKVMRGPAMSLTDAEGLCAFARFCDPKGRVWNLVQQTDN